MPAVLSSLIDVPREGLSAVLAREAPSRPCLREWLARIPDPRGPRGRWHPLEFVLALAVCAFTAAGHDSPSAIADWAAGCDQEDLATLGGRRDPLSGLVRPPCERTFRRIFSKAGGAAVNDAVHGCLAAMPQAGRDDLPEAACREREQRRAAAQALKPPVPGLLPQAAADGKAVRGATRPDGTQVRLLSAFHVGEGRTLAQREVGAKTNEIPELAPALEGLDLTGMVITLDALHAQREAARLITEDHGARYVMFVKANQPPSSHESPLSSRAPTANSATARGPRREKATGEGSAAPSAPPPPTASTGPDPPRSCASAATPAQLTATGPRKEVAYAITSLPPTSPAPSPGHPRPAALEHREPGALRPRRHLPRGRPESPDRQHARQPRSPAQPRHRRIPQGQASPT